MEPGFLGHPYVAEQFVKAHAALQELAKFVQIIIKVKRKEREYREDHRRRREGEERGRGEGGEERKGERWEEGGTEGATRN
jgi:hypothetical protein